MKLAAPYSWAADFDCPHCGTPLNVEDPDDFYWREGPMEREEIHLADCPVCEKEFRFHVTWEPTYPHGAELIGECDG